MAEVRNPVVTRLIIDLLNNELEIEERNDSGSHTRVILRHKSIPVKYVVECVDPTNTVCYIDVLEE